jgi:hypothetical protein
MLHISGSPVDGSPLAGMGVDSLIYSGETSSTNDIFLLNFDCSSEGVPAVEKGVSSRRSLSNKRDDL